MLLDSIDLTSRLCASSRPWRHVDIRDVVDSTNTVALELSTADGQPWRLVAADHQSGGRGRQGRVWSSPPGTSISLSMVVPLEGLDPLAPGPPGSRAQRIGWLPLLAGLAVSHALGRLSGRPAAFAVKWPNDVLARPTRSVGPPDAPPTLKVCGILCQAILGAPNGSPSALAVVGIGVNVCVDASELPVPDATSLADCCARRVPTREEVIVAIADEFVWWYSQFADNAGGMARVQSAYDVACATLGEQVRVHLPGERTLLGRAERVDSQGRL
ncbi:MAG: biotin--[acetyl-CoA-carboxylase] ligase, partial [Micrococcales bacterium]|nr:biotin--[acetyl-CoA-carboxylase] ligase [Micrococcales bacterium]